MKVLFAKRCWEDWCTSDMFTAKEQPVPRNSPAQPNMAEVVEQVGTIVYSTCRLNRTTWTQVSRFVFPLCV